MATNYGRDKRRIEDAKKKRRAEKELRKRASAAVPAPENTGVENPAAETPAPETQS